MAFSNFRINIVQLLALNDSFVFSSLPKDGHFTERSNTTTNGTQIGRIALNFAQSVFQLIVYKNHMNI